MIAGSTGSGKSEFIITYILSLAVNYSPEDVAFVLIDYKLDDKYEFEGSNLMHYIDNAIPDLQCALFTSNI